MMTDLVRPMTADEYFALPETNQITELIDGELIVAPVPIAYHQIVSGNAYYFLRTEATSGKAYYAPIALRFDDHHVFEPDVIWIRQGGECHLVDKYHWIGAPDLVIEILSPSTAKRDRGVKFEVYERHGVREYWLIDLDSQFIEVYSHQNGAFKHVGAYGVDEKFTSPVLGVEVKGEAIFAL
jgi:Uma2 family endonuclease